MLARGLVLDHDAKLLVATPFPKFFNVGEGGRLIPDLPFEAFEKLDGSLAIIHHHGGCWRAVTKGDFQSDQAKWAEAQLDAQDLSALVPGTTYLAEAVHPGNRIVIRYEQAALILLAAYDETGVELGYDQVREIAASLGWPTAQRRAYASFGDMLQETRTLPRTAEGFVIRFENGLRLKAKGDEYRRIHALISRCTLLAMWQAMLTGDDLIAIRCDLPGRVLDGFRHHREPTRGAIRHGGRPHRRGRCRPSFRQGAGLAALELAAGDGTLSLRVPKSRQQDGQSLPRTGLETDPPKREQPARLYPVLRHGTVAGGIAVTDASTPACRIVTKITILRYNLRNYSLFRCI
jgi:RNA ligase